ncbi:MAG: 30S ribosomal protein S16 [Candidatus Liptonbacteria bacterium RIFCSPLOWO2_01_FULL_52_25]|uniref:Small ribosomal subunit protein bS16 n=1 Tax=Candidatus Liptonbacteria bacterium RIFCSPLOWO2_01_FULL_52_25 TaxID=1798650 RepID=A0A1G2CDD2_9BACT|nr:MAG: 30S ribosomal protein S16 [Candidatus Liptonbacteria bacterium RIFCSPLOWO2_01_FULL_52_25]
MLAIKLQRVGKKHQPSFRVVVAERRSKLNGPPVEDLGSYDIRVKKLDAKKDRVEHWLKMGAQPTTTVWNLLVTHKLADGKKIAVKMKKPVVVISAEAKPASPEAAKPTTETPAA